ncbi:MAG: hypothetical protein Q8L85_07740 [Alphaproteobacteria bacterium]|nr:hypothetical protein [Alphaproteobacteria bacterium]
MRNISMWAVIAAFFSCNVIAIDASSLNPLNSVNSANATPPGNSVIVVNSGDSADDPMTSYGDVSKNVNVQDIDSSAVQIGSSGNITTLSGPIDKLQIAAENYGDMAIDVNVSKVTGSSISIKAAGNAIRVK